MNGGHVDFSKSAIARNNRRGKSAPSSAKQIENVIGNTTPF